MSRRDRTFDDVLQEIRLSSKNTVELGTRFEALTRNFLLTDARYKDRFIKVHRWKNWKYNDGPDTGIDLVGEAKDGSWCAIQCKCYDVNNTLDLKTIGTFFTKATALAKKHKKKVYTILAHTSDRITPNACRVIEDHKCHTMGLDVFRTSGIIWNDFPKLRTKMPKALRDHQIAAVENVVAGLAPDSTRRGKLIMACGTGKTLTSLRIAEKIAGAGKTVLYLVPSISLIQQTMKEWSENAMMPHYYSVVCSDKTAGEHEEGSVTELSLSPTTNVKELVDYFSQRPANALGVVFSTYHSVDVARKANGDKPFDLVLCDEAHRTTGIEKKATHFTRVHDDHIVKGVKRLYMTATPRVYGEVIKSKQNVHSMDDPATYGEDLHVYSFSDAVEDGQLADFKVRVPVISEKDLERYTAESIEGVSEDGTIDERVLLAAVWHALNYNNDEKTPLLEKVIAFTNKIAASKQFSGFYNGADITLDEERYAKKIKKNEDEGRITQNRSFSHTVEKYEMTSDNRTGNEVLVRHIDGAMPASTRNNKLQWLRSGGENPCECRILSNARCLSEGIDVPDLDGVIFLQPRKSTTDVVQSVGRVMRAVDGKEFGYVVLPVVIPTGLSVEDSLYDAKAWKTVWQVLSALRSHNPNFANEINRVHLDRGPGGYPPPLDNVEIVWMGSLSRLPEPELFGKLVTRMVDKVGDRAYFDERAKELGQKARFVCGILNTAYENGNKQIIKTIRRLCNSLKALINDSVNEEETIRVLSQHYALSQVFRALFDEESRLSNPVAIALDDAMQGIGLRNELEKFNEFFEDVKNEAKKFTNEDGKQSYINKIYGNFLQGFDKKEQKARGVVYTPDEVIGFILNSIEHILRTEFKTGFNRNDVKVFDPFTGTGAFITKLLESNFIKSDKLKSKYAHDIWANEISLLAYYVASVNIESVFKKISNNVNHLSFNHINYTDTLNHNPRYRADERHRHENIRIDQEIKKAHDNIQKSKWQHIHVIIGNPPYSAKQKKADDNRPNASYDDLDQRIKSTYVQAAKESNPEISNVTSLYDLYIRSLRWASDRIGRSGIVGFVTNGGFLRSETGAGIRACLAKEFSEVWCFDLRGDQNTQGETSDSEGGKIFGSDSKASVAITILVKNPRKEGCVIRYRDIGDKLHQVEKLKIIADAKSITGIADWTIITPNQYHDWVNPRGSEDKKFMSYHAIGDKQTKSGKADQAIFKLYSSGVKTHRDSWAYNFSRHRLTKNMQLHIGYVNSQSDVLDPRVDPTMAAFTPGLQNKLKKLGHQKPKFDIKNIRLAQYRPFFRQYLYFDIPGIYTEMVYQVPKFFPDSETKNLVICVPNKFKGKFSVFVTNITPDMQLNSNGQCFPLYTYLDGQKTDNITDTTLKRYWKCYNNSEIKKKDIFYYVYGMLHHKGYRNTYANSLQRTLPRVPLAPDFWGFRDVGRALANLHLHYNTGTKYDLGKPKFLPKKFTKLAFGTLDDGNTLNKSTICDDGTTVFDTIPTVSYTVNGRTPVEWLVDRYNRKVDDHSGVVNDPLSELTGQDVVNLIRRLVHVGVESDRLVKSLPKVFEPKNWTNKTGLDVYTGPESPNNETR